MDKQPTGLESKLFNQEVSNTSYELVFNPEYLKMKSIMNSESLDIISSEPLWMTCENLERIRTLTKTDNVKASNLAVHPLFTRAEAGAEFELVDSEDFDAVQKYLYYIKNKDSFSKDEAKEITACGPYNHGSKYMCVLLGVSDTGIMSLNNAFEDDGDKSCIVKCLLLADTIATDVRELIYHKHRDVTDSRIPENFETKLAECFEMSNEIVSRFTFLLAKKPNLNVSEMDSEIISYQDFDEIWQKIRSHMDKLYDLRVERFELESIEGTHKAPNDEEVELAKDHLDTSYSLLKKVYLYVREKTQSF